MSKTNLRYTFLFIMFLTFVSLINMACERVAESGELTHLYVEASHPAFENLRDMEDKTPIILIGTKEAEINPYNFVDDTGREISEFSMAHIKVDKIIKNHDSISLDSEQMIPVLENEYQKDSTVFHIGGYQKMELGKKYLLFLYYSEHDNWYVINGVVFGKVPTSTSESLLYGQKGDSPSLPEKVIREAQESYKHFFGK